MLPFNYTRRCAPLLRTILREVKLTFVICDEGVGVGVEVGVVPTKQQIFR